MEQNLQEFILNAQFISGGGAGLLLGFFVGKILGSAKKAKEVRSKMGV